MHILETQIGLSSSKANHFKSSTDWFGKLEQNCL